MMATRWHGAPGLATVAPTARRSTRWYRWLGWGEFGDDDCPTDEIDSALGVRDAADDARAASTIRPIRI